MADDMLTPENVSIETLRGILDAAYMDTNVTPEGELTVKERFTNRFWWPENRSRVQIFCSIRCNEKATVDAKLRYVNKVNDKLPSLRAVLMEAGHFTMDIVIPVQGGIAKKAFVLAFRSFLSQVNDAMAMDADDVLG